MKPLLTKIYFIALFSSFFGLRSQDTLRITTKQHFFASLQAGTTFMSNFKIYEDVIPITALFFSYIPKKSNIILSIGPSFSPMRFQNYFGFGINAKSFLGKKISKHNSIVEFGDRISWNQQSFDNTPAVKPNKYSLNNLYMGVGYFVFLGKESQFFCSLTGNVSINTYKTIYESKQTNASSSGLSSYSGTSISQAIFIHAGMKLR